jgi:2-C-methyl-D-erythritol 4-phosphate cytidylyltransferase
MNESVSKQYLPLRGKPLLVYSLLVFQSCPLIGEILVTVRATEKDRCQHDVIELYGFTKVSRLVEGGPRRQDSVYEALQYVPEETDLVAIHDGVRPFVTIGLLTRSLQAAEKDGAVVVGIPVTDTVKQLKARGMINRTLERQHLWASQTPQAFRFDLIKRAYEEAKRTNFEATDDASLLEQMGVPVRMIEGSTDNIKVTTPEDLILAEALLRER